MNKRQKKKLEKRKIYIFADEFNLLTMTDEEREKAWRDYKRFSKKYAFFKTYKEYKASKMKRLYYSFPVSESFNSKLQEVNSNINGIANQKNSHKVTQRLSDFLNVKDK